MSHKEQLGLFYYLPEIRKPLPKLSDEDQATADQINEWCARCFKDGIRWWRDPATGQDIQRNFGELISLCHSELSEMLEADRKNLMCDHLPHLPGVSTEAADVLIRLWDICGALGIDLGRAFVEKRNYNRTREDHTAAARLGPGGKRY